MGLLAEALEVPVEGLWVLGLVEGSRRGLEDIQSEGPQALFPIIIFPCPFPFPCPPPFPLPLAPDSDNVLFKYGSSNIYSAPFPPLEYSAAPTPVEYSAPVPLGVSKELDIGVSAAAALTPEDHAAEEAEVEFVVCDRSGRFDSGSERGSVMDDDESRESGSIACMSTSIESSGEGSITSRSASAST